MDWLWRLMYGHWRRPLRTERWDEAAADGWRRVRMRHLRAGDIVRVESMRGEFRVVAPPFFEFGVWAIRVEQIQDAPEE